MAFAIITPVVRAMCAYNWLPLLPSSLSLPSDEVMTQSPDCLQLSPKVFLSFFLSYRPRTD